MINSSIIIFFHPASLFVYQNTASVFPPAKARLAAQIKAVPGSFQLRLEWIRKERDELFDLQARRPDNGELFISSGIQVHIQMHRLIDFKMLSRPRLS